MAALLRLAGIAKRHDVEILLFMARSSCLAATTLVVLALRVAISMLIHAALAATVVALHHLLESNFIKAWTLMTALVVLLAAIFASDTEQGRNL